MSARALSANYRPPLKIMLRSRASLPVTSQPAESANSIKACGRRPFEVPPLVLLYIWLLSQVLAALLWYVWSVDDMRRRASSAHEPTPAAGDLACAGVSSTRRGCVDVCFCVSVCGVLLCGCVQGRVRPACVWMCVGPCAPRVCVLDCIRFTLPFRTRLNHNDGCSLCLGRIGQGSGAGIYMYFLACIPTCDINSSRSHAAVCVRRARRRFIWVGSPWHGHGSVFLRSLCRGMCAGARGSNHIRLSPAGCRRLSTVSPPRVLLPPPPPPWPSHPSSGEPPGGTLSPLCPR